MGACELARGCSDTSRLRKMSCLGCQSTTRYAVEIVTADSASAPTSQDFTLYAETN